MAAMAGVVSAVDQREESNDPLATPDVDKYSFLSKLVFLSFLFFFLICCVVLGMGNLSFSFVKLCSVDDFFGH